MSREEIFYVVTDNFIRQAGFTTEEKKLYQMAFFSPGEDDTCEYALNTTAWD